MIDDFFSIRCLSIIKYFECHKISKKYEHCSENVICKMKKVQNNRFSQFCKEYKLIGAKNILSCWYINHQNVFVVRKVLNTMEITLFVFIFFEVKIPMKFS